MSATLLYLVSYVMSMPWHPVLAFLSHTRVHPSVPVLRPATSFVRLAVRVPSAGFTPQQLAQPMVVFAAVDSRTSPQPPGMVYMDDPATYVPPPGSMAVTLGTVMRYGRSQSFVLSMAVSQVVSRVRSVDRWVPPLGFSCEPVSVCEGVVVQGLGRRVCGRVLCYSRRHHAMRKDGCGHEWGMLPPTISVSGVTLPVASPSLQWVLLVVGGLFPARPRVPGRL